MIESIDVARSFDWYLSQPIGCAGTALSSSPADRAVSVWSSTSPNPALDFDAFTSAGLVFYPIDHIGRVLFRLEVGARSDCHVFSLDQLLIYLTICL